MITQLHHSEGFELSAVCHALGVARSSYYARLSPGCAQSGGGDAGLADQIEEIFREHRARYGSRRIVAELGRRGVDCGRSRVRRILSERGLKALKTPRKFVPPTSDGGAKEPAPNLLLDRDPPSGIDQVWVADITYIPMAGAAWLYLATVMDLHSRRIVAWKLGRSLRAELVVAPLKRAITTRRPPPGLIVHSDRGSQYGSAAFRRPLRAIRALQSMSRKANCYDNAFMESCFGTIKDEMLEDGAFASFEDAHTELFEYIEIYYNRKRIHSSLGGLSPEEFENNTN